MTMITDEDLNGTSKNSLINNNSSAHNNHNQQQSILMSTSADNNYNYSHSIMQDEIRWAFSQIKGPLDELVTDGKYLELN